MAQNCYIIPQCNHTLDEAKVIRDLIAEKYSLVNRKTMRDGGKGAIVITTAKPIAEDDLRALGLSAPVGEAYASRILTS